MKTRSAPPSSRPPLRELTGKVANARKKAHATTKSAEAAKAVAKRARKASKQAKKAAKAARREFKALTKLFLVAKRSASRARAAKARRSTRVRRPVARTTAAPVVAMLDVPVIQVAVPPEIPPAQG